MASIPREFNGNVDKSGIFQAVKSCMPPSSGFNMRVNQLLVWVDDKDKSHDEIIKSYPDYGLVLAKIGPSVAASAPSPSSRIAIYEGMAVYYAGFSEDEGTYMCHRGRISSITSNNQHFTIDGTPTNISPGSPVFTYDKVNRVIHLTGVIGKSHDSIIRAVHIDCFRNDQIKAIEELGEERGGILVQIGEFKGREKGEGPGSRKIVINGPAGGTYKLTFVDGSKKQANPHSDPNYNKDQPRLYHEALQGFINKYNSTTPPVVPNDFTFEFRGTLYTGTRE
jgi:hypothetical protein